MIRRLQFNEKGIRSTVMEQGKRGEHAQKVGNNKTCNCMKTVLTETDSNIQVDELIVLSSIEYWT